MSSTLKRRDTLPSISEVDRADNHLGLLLSDLDWMESAVKRFAGTSVDIQDEMFLQRHGIASDEEEPCFVDPAMIARLLVFANELEGDAEAIREYACGLRGSLLSIYRENIFEPSGRKQMRGGGDDA